MVRKVLVDFCCLLIECQVEWMLGSFESLFKIDSRDICYKATPNETHHFCHLAEPLKSNYQQL